MTTSHDPSVPWVQSLRHEREIIGHVLLNPDLFGAFKQIRPDDFQSATNGEMWKSIAELAHLRIPVTPSTLVSHLETLGRLEGLGGPESVRSFIDVLDIKPKPELYMRQVSEIRFRSDLRRLTQAASDPRTPAQSLLEQMTMLSDQYRKSVGTESKLKFHCGGCDEPEFQNAIKWICRPWIAEGAITEVVGKLKMAGKTTFVSHMIKSILKGAPFLGQETTQTGVVYLSEQPRTSFRASMQRVNAIAEPQFFFLTAPETITNEWNKLTEAAISECLDRNAKVLVVDTIGQLARMPGDSENNAGDALTVLQPLQRAASKGLGVVIIRHERKSGGDVGDSGRGSTAFGGAVDTIISIRRPDGNSRLTLRELRAVSRFDGVPDSLLVDLEPDGYSVRERGDLVAEAAEKAVHDFLAKRATSGATEEEIVEATEMPRATVKRALRALPGVTKTGKGVRNEAYRFVLNANN